MHISDCTVWGNRSCRSLPPRCRRRISRSKCSCPWSVRLCSVVFQNSTDSKDNKLLKYCRKVILFYLMRDILTITNWAEIIWTHLIATPTRIGNLDVHSELGICYHTKLIWELLVSTFGILQMTQICVSNWIRCTNWRVIVVTFGRTLLAVERYRGRN